MIKLYQDPIFGSQYYLEELPNIKDIKYVPSELNFSLSKWQELISLQKTPIIQNKNILNANKRDLK